jgi:hypothetical protein
MLILSKIFFQIVFLSGTEWDRLGQVVPMALSQSVPVKNRGFENFF